MGERNVSERGILVERSSMDEGVPMKTRLQVILSAFLLLVIPACANIDFQSSTPSPVPHGPEIHGVFAGNTPCIPQARPLLQIPEDADCDQIIWSLVLRQDPQTGAPTTYSLKSAYGLSKQGTNNLVGGGTSYFDGRELERSQRGQRMIRMQPYIKSILMTLNYSVISEDKR